VLFIEGTGPREWQMSHEGVAKEQKGIVRVEEEESFYDEMKLLRLALDSLTDAIQAPNGGTQVVSSVIALHYICKSSYSPLFGL